MTLKLVTSKPKLSEAQIQKAFFEWLHARYPMVAKTTFHPVNEGKRSYAGAAFLKKQGMTKGVADIICLWPTDDYNGAVIELKAPGKKLTHEQSEFLAYCSNLGYWATWFDDLDVLIRSFEGYLTT